MRTGGKVSVMDRWRALKPGLSLKEDEREREPGIGQVMLSSDAERISKQESQRGERCAFKIS